MSNKNSMPLSMRSGTSLTRALVLLTLDELINHCVHGGARDEEIALRRAKLEISLGGVSGSSD